MKEDSHSTTIVGWREWVNLPSIGVPWIKAKLDTGARSSALHAFDIEEIDDGQRVRFKVRPWQRSMEDIVEVECDIHDRRVVRSSSGHEENRIVVLIDVKFGDRVVVAETTLSQRDQMDFRMLIGREALRQGFLLNPRKSFLTGRPTKIVRRRNHARD